MHLSKLRTLVPAASLSSKRTIIPRATTRTLKYLVQPSAIGKSSRFFPVAKDSDSSRQQLFEKMWTLSGTKPLEKLKLRLPGVTFISVDPHEVGLEPDQVATIRATSDSVHALERMSLKVKFPYRTVLAFEPSAHAPSHGNLLTEILLPRGCAGRLRSLATKGQGLVIIEDGVLAIHDRPDAIIKLAATHGSKIAINLARDVDVSKLQIAVANRSKVFFQAPTFKARDRVEIAGAGGSEVHVQSLNNGFESPLLKLAISGSGTFSVQAKEFAVSDIKSAIVGSGRIVLGKDEARGSGSAAAAVGVCSSHKIAIFGSGDVDCADMITKRVALAVAGQGSVVLDVTEPVKVGEFGTATVKYLNNAPLGPTPVAAMSDEDRSVRKQRRDLETQEVLNFWRSLPLRESAMDVVN